MKQALPILAVFIAACAAAQSPRSSSSSVDPATDASRPPGNPGMQDTVFFNDYIRSLSSVTEVFGDGQRLTAAVIEYDAPIRNASLSPTGFAIAGRSIVRIYANDRPAKAARGKDGRFVVIELDPADDSARVYDAQGPVLRQGSITVGQSERVQTAARTWYPPTTRPIANTRQVNLVVDDFRQFRFEDPETGLFLVYNLFVPEGYDPGKTYPLVLFMHDLGATNLNPYATLVQGLGATVWASPEQQARHPAFVLAPQYPVALASDNAQTSVYADITIRLLQHLQGQYAIDPKRLYATGQSGGCMTAIALGIQYPDLFAASFLVAGQWDASLVAPMANSRLWIMVSEDDAKAYPGMNAIAAELERLGGKVTRAAWDGTASAEEFDSNVAAILEAGPDSNIYYVALRKGTVIPPGESAAGAAGHRNAWRIAYTIEGIRDWLFQQSR